jgi:hypothetical protein
VSKGKAYLYRFLPFQMLVEIFETGRLSFSCPSIWDDPYEPIVKHDLYRKMFAQCWSRVSVSDAMWRIYSPDRYSVRITTTEKALRDQMTRALSDGSRFRWKMGDVHYRSTRYIKEMSKDLRPRLFSESAEECAIDSLLYKRSAFQHEGEYRVAVFHRAQGRLGDRIPVPVDPHALVRAVMMDPRAPNAIVDVMQFYLKKKIGFKGRVKRSSLYEAPEG